MSVLECRNLRRAFGRRGRVVALDGCSFDATPGEVLGLVGPNGAGKTTLLRLLAGELPPSAGEARIDGHRAGTRAARRLVGYAPDPPLAPPELTGAEWLSYLASHRSRSLGERARLVGAAAEWSALDGVLGRRTGTYSRGTTQRLALAAAALLGSRVLLLDETLSGVDPVVHRALRERLVRVAGEGRLVVIASHDLAALERFATRVLVLSRGRVAADVSIAELLRERVAEIVLSGGSLAGVGRLQLRFRGATRTGQGIAVPLRNGLSLEAVLAACREARVPVAESRVRYRALEDILLRTVANGRAPCGFAG